MVSGHAMLMSTLMRVANDDVDCDDYTNDEVEGRDDGTVAMIMH